MSEKLLTIREVAHLLSVSEKEVIECSERGEIPAYKVGGVYLRFQKDQVENYKQKTKMAKMDAAAGLSAQAAGITAAEQLRDFFYFYDFYILSAILIAVLLVIITRA